MKNNPWRLDLSRRDVLAAGGALAAALASHGVAALTADAEAAAGGGRGFDFLHGEWHVLHRKLRKRLAGNHDWFEFPGTLSVEPILGGKGNFDRNALADPHEAYEAHSLRLFNADSGKWSIWWLDSRSPAIDPPVVGGFEGTKGSFYSNDTFAGRPIRVRTTYEPMGPEHAEWTQAFSPDGGASWEVNWIMEFTRSAR